MKKIAVLISGRGSNLKSLIDAQNEYDSFYIADVIANKECDGLKHATNSNIKTKIILSKNRTRHDFEDELHEYLMSNNIQIVVLAGFMRVLTENFISKWENKIVNIHPSLLPSFKGLHTHERVIEYGVKYHGCTVHFVTPGLDEGPIIGQNVVVVRQDDTPEKLAYRVLCCEHTLFPYCLDIVCRDAFLLEGRKVILK